MAGSDRIHIEELQLFARVGVTERERSRPQRITLTITVWPKDPFDDMQDDISRTVNYSSICVAAREFVETRSDNLIETLVSELASHLLKQFPVRTIEVELRKFVLPDAKYAAVAVRRDAVEQ